MRNVLVTGGAGFIGSHLVARLLAEGRWRVTVVDDFNDFYDPALKRRNVSAHLGREDFALHEADIRDRAALGELFAGAEFDVIIHLAARAGVRAAMDYEASGYEVINLGGSRTVSLSELIALLEGELGRKAVIDRRPTQPGDVPRTYADVSKARRLLGYDPRTPIEEGVRRFVQWFSSDGGR